MFNEQSLVDDACRTLLRRGCDARLRRVSLAFNGLVTRGHMQAGDYVLLEGTGGVSVFGLQFAVAAGAKPIITSSSDDKLERAKKMGAIGGVNYKTNPDWEKGVRAITGDVGVQHVLEVGGKDTLQKALTAVGPAARSRSSAASADSAARSRRRQLMSPNITVNGLYVGSRENFEAMNAFIVKHQIKPVIDKVVELQGRGQGVRAHGVGGLHGEDRRFGWCLAGLRLEIEQGAGRRQVQRPAAARSCRARASSALSADSQGPCVAAGSGTHCRSDVDDPQLLHAIARVELRFRIEVVAQRGLTDLDDQRMSVPPGLALRYRSGSRLQQRRDRAAARSTGSALRRPEFARSRGPLDSEATRHSVSKSTVMPCGLPIGAISMITPSINSTRASGRAGPLPPSGDTRRR